MIGGTESRIVSLDLLRGAAVAGMILVVSPGDWSQVYMPLRHAAWDGWTLADMVFPAFLFGVGVALGLSFPRDWDGASQHAFWRKLARRALALVALGLLVEASYVWAIAVGAPAPGRGDLAHLRLPGVLQRIGLCYGLAGILVATLAGRTVSGRRSIDPGRVALLVAALLLGYGAAMTAVPVPGWGVGRLDPAGNLAAFVDRAVFGAAHLWPLGQAVPGGPVVYDPEGLLASVPATANVLVGVSAAAILQRGGRAATRPLLIGGGLLFVAGFSLDPVFVINKRLWTSSFSLLSAGFSAMLLAATTVLARHPPAVRALRPLQVLGGNAILAFLLSTAMSRLAGFALVPDGAAGITPQQWGYRTALAMVGDSHLASLLCAVGVVAVVAAVLWPLHTRAIHFRL